MPDAETVAAPKTRPTRSRKTAAASRSAPAADPVVTNVSLMDAVVRKRSNARRAASVAAAAAVARLARDGKGNGTHAKTSGEAVEALLAGASPDDAKSIRRALRDRERVGQKPLEQHPDEVLAADWRSGAYPYKNRMSRKTYEEQKYLLQVELLKLQAWVKETGQRVVILFEGRDAAGKGATRPARAARSSASWST